MTDHLTQSSFNNLNSINKPSFQHNDHHQFDKAAAVSSKKKDKVIIAVTSKKSSTSSSVRKHSTRESGTGGDKSSKLSIVSNNVKQVEKTSTATTRTTQDTSSASRVEKKSTSKRRNKKKALGFEIEQPIIEEEKDEEDDYMILPGVIGQENETQNEEQKATTTSLPPIIQTNNVDKEEHVPRPGNNKIKSKPSRSKTDEDRDRKQRRNSRSHNEETNSSSSLNNSHTDAEDDGDGGGGGGSETENLKAASRKALLAKSRKNGKKSKQVKKKEQVNDETEYYDLYNTEPDIIYLKQKYRMYLDWLSHNHLQKTNLNWYQYEISLNYRENNKDYLKKCLNNFFTTSKSDTSPVRVINKPSVVGASSRHNSFAFANNNNNNLATTYLPKLSNRVNKQTSLSQSSPHVDYATHRTSGAVVDNNNNHSGTVTLPPLINNKKLFRGVKFDSGSSYLDPRFVSNSSGYFNYAGSTTGSTSSFKKPILKQHNETSSHEQLRRASIHSLGGGSSSNDKNSDQNSDMMSMKMSVSSSSTKLPPIARCSDDFYAVLNDLENFI